MSLTFTAEEQAAVAPVEARFSERARRPMSLSSLLSSWAGIVDEIEGGYEATIDDYTNDLATRDLIDDAIGSVPESIKEKLESAVKPLDERFVGATRPDETQLIGQYFNHGPEWWWSRLPVTLRGDALLTFRTP